MLSEKAAVYRQKQALFQEDEYGKICTRSFNFHFMAVLSPGNANACSPVTYFPSTKEKERNVPTEYLGN